MRRPLGQHFLFDPNILRKIVECADISKEDTVVEIGPGHGRLTGIISEHAKRVIAIEYDKKLSAKLKEVLAENKNIDILEADALKFPYEKIRGKFRVVANIPYYITTPLIFRLLEFKGKIPTMTLLLQKEVAKRIVASHGSRDYGVLSISAQLYTKPAMKFTVSRKAFSPPPAVDSAVVHFEVSDAPLFDLKDTDIFFSIVRKSFSQRRKTIIKSLRPLTDIKEALSVSGIDPGIRPEKLSIGDFVRLANVLFSMSGDREKS